MRPINTVEINVSLEFMVKIWSLFSL